MKQNTHTWLAFALISLAFAFPALAGEVTAGIPSNIDVSASKSGLTRPTFPALGLSWSMVKDLVTSQDGGVECLAKVGPTHVVAGYSMSVGGLYYSSDMGLTWTKSSIASSTNYSWYNYVAGDGKGTVITASYANPGGIYRSTNYGANFKTVFSGSTYPRNIAYLGSDTWIIGGYSTTTHRLYRSTNNGATWTAYASDTVDLPGACSGIALAGDRVFLRSSSGIWVSYDRGATWTTASTGSFGVGGGLAYLGNGVLVFPKNSSPIEILRSSDFGQTWTTVKSIPNSGGAMWTTLNIGNGRVLMVGSDDGSAGAKTATMYQSLDYGQTWNAVYVFPEHHVYSSVYLGDGTALMGAWPSAYIYRSKGL